MKGYEFISLSELDDNSGRAEAWERAGFRVCNVSELNRDDTRYVVPRRRKDRRPVGSSYITGGRKPLCCWKDDPKPSAA